MLKGILNKKRLCLGGAFFLCFLSVLYAGPMDSPLTPIRELINEGKFENAQAELTALIKANPDDGDAYILTGELYQHLGEKYEELSLRAYKQAISKPKTRLSGTIMLGRAYFRNREYELCVSNLESVVHEIPNGDPRLYTVLVTLGKALLKQSKYDSSIKYLEKCKKLKKTPEVLYFLGFLHEKKNLYDQALEYYDKLEKDFPKDPLIAKVEERRKNILRGDGGDGVLSITDPKILALLDLDINQKKYPNAGAVVLLNDVSITVHPDKTSTTVVHKIVKILNDRGKKYGEVSLDYDSSYQSVKVDFARTITKDRKVLTVGDKSVRDLAPWAGYPLYSNARMLVVSMPEVMKGAFIEYKATWHSRRLIGGKYFQVSHGVEVFEPKLKDRFKVTLPAYMDVMVGYKNFPYAKAKEHTEGGSKIYVWESENIPEILSEPYMPPWGDVTPRFYLSSFKTWDEIGSWFWGLAKTQFVADSSIEAQVKKLIKGKKTDYSKAKAIFHYVASKIRYVGIEYGESGYKPHKATEIFENKYGDCKDQSTLLVTMLRVAGIESQLVLLGTRDSGTVFMELPMVQFNHCIAMTVIDGKKIWMDPTYATASFDYLPWNDQDCRVMVMYGDGAVMEKTPLQAPKEARMVKSIELEMFADKTVKGKFKLSAYGEHAIGYRGLKYSKPKKRKDYFQSIVASMYPGGKLTNYTVSDLEDLNNPVQITLEYVAPDGFKKAGPLGIFKMPLSRISAGIVSLDKRKYDLLLSGTSSQVLKVSVKVPEEYKVRFLPKGLNYNDKFGSTVAQYSKRGKYIFYTSKSSLNKINIPQKEYQEYKKRQEKRAKESDQPVIFEKRHFR